MLGYRPPAMASKRTAPKAPPLGVTADGRPLLGAWVALAGLGEPFEGALVAWLAKQLMGDQFAKLEQGGHQEGGIPLRKVFVDLPISSTPRTHRSEERWLFLKNLLSREPAALCAPPEPSLPLDDRPHRMGRSAAKTAGYIVIGGPGQGKSTLGQLACQAHRAALLAPYVDKLTPPQREVVRSYIEPSARKEIGFPKEPLFPLRVVLPEAAAWLAVQEREPEHPSLLLFVTRRDTAQGVSAERLLKLLEHVPCLYVFDGLDEIGAPEDRAAVVGAARALLTVHRALDPKGLVIAATRPQGYTGELERLDVPLLTVHLSPLEKDEAIAYGEKLAHIKLVDRHEDQRRIVAGLSAAADDPATARLLTTPLQVTILVALVQKMGKPPRARWELFQRYFETIYDRETERGTYAAALLREHRTHILALHERVGLLLQVEAEQAGGTEARVSRERLEGVVAAVLRDAGMDDDAIAPLVRQIVRAAEDRLVFLVEPEPGKFGFEIRSLQEHMAAQALSADDSLTRARLEHIAPSPSFRNVALFMASKIFSGSNARLKEALANDLCASIERDEASRTVKAGALLALEILQDGTSLNQPKYARKLMEQACKVLDLAPCLEQTELLEVAQGPLERVLGEAMAARLQDPNALGALGAWVVLVRATNMRAAWAIGLGESAWRNVLSLGEVLRACERLFISLGREIVAHLERQPQKVPPLDLRRNYLGEEDFPGKDRPSQSGWVHSFLSDTDGDVPPWKLDDTRAFWTDLENMPNPPPLWVPWVISARFCREPSAMSLAKALHAMTPPDAWAQRFVIAEASTWPLTACLKSADSAEDLATYAKMAEAGVLGDIDLWRASERRWGDSVDWEASVTAAIDSVPWSIPTLAEAPPLGALTTANFAAEVLSKFLSPPKLRTHELTKNLALTVVHFAEGIEDTVVRAWVEVAKASGLFLSQLMHAESEGLIEWLDAVGRRREINFWDTHVGDPGTFASLYSNHPECQGLLYWLNRSVTSGRFKLAIGDGAKFVLEAIQSNPPSDPGLQSDAMLLRVALGDLAADEVDSALDLVLAHNPAERVIRAAQSDYLPAATREKLLLALLSRPNLSWEIVSDAQDALRDSLRSRQSGLADHGTWTKLGLPLPLPEVRAPLHHETPLPEAPVALSRVELHQIRGLRDFAMDLSLPPSGSGQWVVILGPNGAGKTTLLRAIALALRDTSDPAIWPEGIFDTPWRTIGATSPSTIAVNVAGGRAFTVKIQKNGSEQALREPKGHPAPFPIFAYGCRRGSALGGTSREVNTRKGGAEIATLFREGADLVHAETWIKEWHGASKDDPKINVVYNVILRALAKLLDVDSVFVRGFDVLVTGASIGREIPFAALSDGYLTTAGWFLDLLARWVDLAFQRKVPIDDGLLARMTGLVLLDEIDLHLHPQWQVETIRRIKGLLPKMSFLVTTHNPLTLVGAKPEEIAILSMSGAGVEVERGVEPPMLLTGGQIYSEYFGIKSLYPHALGEAVQRYGFLSGDPLRTDEEQAELERLRRELESHGIEPGWEETPRQTKQPPLPKPKRIKRRRA